MKLRKLKIDGEELSELTNNDVSDETEFPRPTSRAENPNLIVEVFNLFIDENMKATSVNYTNIERQKVYKPIS